MRERRAEVIEMENRWRDSYTSRERWRIIEFIEFEDDNYKLIKKVRVKES